MQAHSVRWRPPLTVVLLVMAALLVLTPGAWASVYLNVPTAQPERPANLPEYAVTLNAPHDFSKSLNVQTFVNRITWTSWGGTTATGTGTVEVVSSDTRPGHEQPYSSQTAPVTITASGLASCGGQPIYTAYSLTLLGSASEPRDFHYARERVMPCRLLALNYYAGYEKVAGGKGDCLFHGVTEPLPSGFGYLGYCKMRWQGWGSQKTVGTGIGRAVTLPKGCDGHHSECDYGVRVTLTRPGWCPTYGMSYTHERLEVFGHGILTATSLIARSEERRLRATIGHARRRVYLDHVRPSQHCLTV